ncbi:glycine zipper domain-containing protein [Dankookia sp. GCM10030260]|uniref:glycine zipper domain-containing protein n=1 Tax=Dankookia sp. GCM10030260 TaxID=3273390 RepID=UPI00361D7D44
MRPKSAILLLAGLGLAGCGDLNQTQQRTATGALGGAAVGGVLGSFTGNAGLGALLGAGVGGGGGYLYDQSQQSQQPAYANQRRSRRG